MVLSLLNTYPATSFLQLQVTPLLSGRYFPLTHRTTVVKIPKKSSSHAFAPLCRVNTSVVFGDPWDAVFKVFVWYELSHECKLTICYLCSACCRSTELSIVWEPQGTAFHCQVMKSQKIRKLKLKQETRMACGMVTLQGKSKAWQQFCLEMKSVSAAKLIAITCTRLHEKSSFLLTFGCSGVCRLHGGIAGKGLSPSH